MELQEFITMVKGKSVSVVGIGVSNTPLIKMLLGYGAAVTARDKKTAEELGGIAEALSAMGVSLVLGEGYLDGITEEVIFKTPGQRFDAPQLLTAKEKGCIMTSEMEMFFALCPAPIIAVTGSDGKTTTTTLIYEMLKAGGFTCHLGGNIGKPLLSEVQSISPEDKVVVELSSFQLHTMTQSAHIAVVTNLSPNHLDWHISMSEYIAAKENVFACQNASDTLVINADNEITAGFAKKAKGKVVLFGKNAITGVHIKDNVICFAGTPVLNAGDILLPGAHNVENYMAAIGAVWGMVDVPTIQRVAKTFGGVPHRIELVREVGGIKYYNDSIASSPTRTMACINAFDQKLIIIAGGSDKYIPFDNFGKALAQRAKALVLIGQTAGKIKAAVENAEGEKPPIYQAKTLNDAVLAAKNAASAGDIVVLSPACASFDMFKNFEDRGNQFKECVMRI